MDLIGRYMFRQTAGALVMILTTLALIVWLATALRQISVMTDQGQGFGLFMLITTLAMPGLIATIAPIGLLIASLHTLNRLNGDSELIVLTAAGAPIWRVLWPYLNLGLLVMGATLFVNAYVAPKCSLMMEEMITQMRANVIGQALQPGQFIPVEKGVTVHIRERGQDGVMYGLIMHDERDPRSMMTLEAKRSRILEQDGHSFIEMEDAHIQRRQPDSLDVNILAFDSYIYDLSQLTGEKKITDKPANLKPRQLYLSELMFPTPKQAEMFKTSRRFISELHDRIANALYPLVFVLIAVVHLGYARTTREGRLESLVMAFASATVLRIGGLAVKNIADKEVWAIPLIYAVPVIAIAVMILMLTFNIKPLKFPSISFKLPWLSPAPQK
jgi:lipopolysaccharide export system permease protein